MPEPVSLSSLNCPNTLLFGRPLPAPFIPGAPPLELWGPALVLFDKYGLLGDVSAPFFIHDGVALLPKPNAMFIVLVVAACCAASFTFFAAASLFLFPFLVSTSGAMSPRDPGVGEPVPLVSALAARRLRFASRSSSCARSSLVIFWRACTTGFANWMVVGVVGSLADGVSGLLISA